MKMQFLKTAECLITDKNITSNELRVYLYLTNLFNKEKGYSYPSIKKIAEDVNLSDRTVKSCVARLLELEYMSVGKKKAIKGNYNTYKNFKFLIPDKEEKEPKKKAPKTGVDSDGNKVLDNQISDEEFIAESKERTLEEEVVQETGATLEEAVQAIEYAKSKRAKHIKAYAKNTLKNGWNKKVVAKSNGVSSLGFHNFEGREYNYDNLEMALLGWDKDITLSDCTIK